jgi:serine/threonine-protein kinase
LISGKYGYFAPEQVSGAVLDRRADVFAAGTVLWEMLTGERLFCDPVAEVAPSFDRLLHRTVPPPSSLNRDIPDRLDQIVLRALARSPEQRHVSARALALELEATIEVASPSTVSGFVECVCSKRLASLSRTLSSAKGRTPAPQGVDGTAVTRPAQGETSLSSLSGECSLAETVAERPSARKPRLMPKALAVGTALAALALFLSLRGGSSSNTVSVKTADSAGSRVAGAPPPVEQTLPAVAPQTPDALAAVTDAVPRLDLVEPVPAAKPAQDPGSGSPPSRKRPGTKKTAKRDCDPPTYLDPDGIRVFKEECL